MTRSNKPETIAAIVLAMYGTCAHAADPDAAPLFSFSGFGTVGVVHSSEDKADFISNAFKPNGAGFTHRWSADVDSLVAAQVTANASAKLSAIVQVIAEQNYDDTWRPHVEWANVKYQFTPDISVRVGRTALPIFMVTDSRKVGYANPWVRPPVEVYTLVAVTSNDGIDASLRTTVGETTNTFQVSTGRSDTKFPGGGNFGAGTANARRQVSFVDTLEHGFATVRLNYGQARVTINEIGPLFDAFRQFGPEGDAIADRYDVKDKLVSFLGVGASYDPGHWFVTGEWGRVKTRSAAGDSTGWYATGGYRFGKFTPYATYARIKVDSNTSDPGLTVAAYPPFLAGPATTLNAVLNALLRAKPVQNTLSIGGRWDFAKKAALKIQYDRTRHGPESAGTLINTQPGFQPGGKVNVFSASVDFVF